MPHLARTSRRRSARLVAVGAAAFVTLAVGAAPAVAASPPRDRTVVEVRTFRFRPATLHVRAGTKVVWRNRDQIEHTVTGADAAGDVIDGRLRRAGAKYAVRLEEPGTYEYFCARHPSMTGTVLVR